MWPNFHLSDPPLTDRLPMLAFRVWETIVQLMSSLAFSPRRSEDGSAVSRSPIPPKKTFFGFGRSGTRAGKILIRCSFKIPSGHPQAYILTYIFRPLGRVLGVYTWSPDDQRLPEPSCVLYSSVAACTSKVPDGPQRSTRGARLVPVTKACLSKVN